MKPLFSAKTLTTLCLAGCAALAASLVQADATLGEICDALREVWGTYTEPARI